MTTENEVKPPCHAGVDPIDMIPDVCATTRTNGFQPVPARFVVATWSGNTLTIKIEVGGSAPGARGHFVTVGIDVAWFMASTLRRFRRGKWRA